MCEINILFKKNTLYFYLYIEKIITKEAATSVILLTVANWTDVAYN